MDSLVAADFQKIGDTAMTFATQDDTKEEVQGAQVSTSDPTKFVYHKLCAATEITSGKSKPFTVEGTHIAVFHHEDGFYAVDNRCPHMGYPMSEGSVRDGVLICHWHHWEFDLKTGGCFLSSGDDLKNFPVEVRQDDHLYVGVSPGEKEEARRRLIDRSQRVLDQGLKDRSTFLIAKAVFRKSIRLFAGVVT